MGNVGMNRVQALHAFCEGGMFSLYQLDFVKIWILMKSFGVNSYEYKFLMENDFFIQIMMLVPIHGSFRQNKILASFFVFNMSAPWTS